jgi:alcohol dehydrogenase (NADP+)
MTMNVLGYAAPSAKAELKPFRFERREPRDDDVVIEILYCGVCHTDIHYVQNDWIGSIFPLMPGHEVIGRVANVASGVTRFKPGDNVGVGCMVDSCQHCSACKQDLEQYCEEGPTFTYNSKDRIDNTTTTTFGGY